MLYLGATSISTNGRDASNAQLDSRRPADAVVAIVTSLTFEGRQRKATAEDEAFGKGR